MTLTWDGDNFEFVLKEVVPKLRLFERDKSYIIMAYLSGAETDSDGKTFVEDTFLNGVIKSVDGVTHDYINRVPDHTTEDGKVWNWWQANALFRRIQKALWQYETAKKHDLNKITRIFRWIRGFRQRWREWLVVTVTFWKWWR